MSGILMNAKMELYQSRWFKQSFGQKSPEYLVIVHKK